MQAISLPIPATQLDKGKIRKGQNKKRRERKSKKGFGTSFQNERAGKRCFHKFWARHGTYERETGKRGEQCRE